MIKMMYILLSLCLSSVSIASISEEEARNVFSKLQNESGYHVVLRVNNSYEVNAYTTKTHIEITKGLLMFCDVPAELALVMGHELGHWAYKDPRTNKQSPIFEKRADVNGDYLCRQMGYSGDACLLFMFRMGKIYGPGGGDGIHPTWGNRIKNVINNRI